MFPAPVLVRFTQHNVCECVYEEVWNRICGRAVVLICTSIVEMYPVKKATELECNLSEEN